MMKHLLNKLLELDFADRLTRLENIAYGFGNGDFKLEDAVAEIQSLIVDLSFEETALLMLAWYVIMVDKITELLQALGIDAEKLSNTVKKHAKTQ